MSELIVEVVKIDGILDHPNADRLELAQIKGWVCVVQKGKFKPGDRVVYLPIDSVLPSDVENILFPPESKIKLSNSRIRTIKIRGAISQGMVVKPSEVGLPDNLKLGTSVGEKLGITKFEPEVIDKPTTRGQPKSKRDSNRYFKEYTDLQHYKNYNKLFEDGEMVYVTEKIHGTNFRAGYCPVDADTVWKKIKRFFGFLPEFEFCYGSRRVQLQYKSGGRKNVYLEIVEKYNLDKIIGPGVVIYGEIYGCGIQKGYNYGCGDGERKLVVFDVMKNGEYLDVVQAYHYCDSVGLKYVPIIDILAFDKDKVSAMTSGPSMLSPEQKVREGVVIQSAIKNPCMIGRKILKWINDDYLLNPSNTDFH